MSTELDPDCTETHNDKIIALLINLLLFAATSKIALTSFTNFGCISGLERDMKVNESSSSLFYFSKHDILFRRILFWTLDSS